MKYSFVNVLATIIILVLSLVLAIIVPDKKSIDFFTYSSLITLLLTISGLILTITTIIYSSNNKVIEDVYTLKIEEELQRKIHDTMDNLHKKAKSAVLSEIICIVIIIIVACIDSFVCNTMQINLIVKSIAINDIFVGVKIAVLIFTLYIAVFSVLTVFEVLDMVYVVKIIINQNKESE